MVSFANFIGPKVSFYEIKNKEQILQFLDSKKRSSEEDPEKKWITTWNGYLNRTKLFFRWLYNRTSQNNIEVTESEWLTPDFFKIKSKKSRRLSPYSETEIWDRGEILLVAKYDQYKRNKAILTLMWDLDARNHEITLLKIKDIRLREQYGEGEIPPEAKTGTGPVLLTCSFPYVRDWLNEHPFRNEPESRLLCNLYNGAPIRPDALWTIMKQLRKRIIRLLETDAIGNEEERQKLRFLVNTKRWNPYCIRHSAISDDSDYLPEYALKKDPVPPFL